MAGVDGVWTALDDDPLGDAGPRAVHTFVVEPVGLADEATKIGEIHAELERPGSEKAETTVRHHVNDPGDAGMVELARIEDSGGATRKYYESNIRVFSYTLPEDADESLRGATETTAAELEELLQRLFEDHGDEIKAVADEMRPCECCYTQHYEEFVVRELLVRALIRLGGDGTLDGVID